MRVVAGLLLGLALAAAGCRKRPAEVAVKGQVKGANGRPLVGAVVRFHPVADKGAGRPLSCVTGPGGAFEGQARPGAYRVTLLAVPRGAAVDPGPKDSPVPPGVPARYASPADTPWKVEVPEEGKDDIALNVEQ